MSDDKPELTVLQPEPPGKGVVELLEESLKRARAGEWSAVVVVYVERDGATGDLNSRLPNVSTMVGGMLRAMFGIISDG